MYFYVPCQASMVSLAPCVCVCVCGFLYLAMDFHLFNPFFENVKISKLSV
jgi:hypothetical protein